jgi:hypothetical protein
MNSYKIVGYVSKAGKLAVYKQVARTPDKFNEGKYRVKLKSFGNEPVEFWVDEEKIVAAPPQSEAARERAPKKTCWECGQEFTYAECKANDGDWSDSYCGC